MAAAVDIAMNFWFAALSSPFGVGVIVTDPQRAKAQLYAARKKAGNPALDKITVRTSPINPACELWLVRDLSGGSDEPTPA